MSTELEGKLTTFKGTDKGAEMVFRSSNSDYVASRIRSFFEGNGFKLEKGDPTNGTYGSGSSVGRVAAGGFAGRSKFDVRISSSDTEVHASVASAMSGFSGGVIGVVKERKQRAKVIENLKTYLA
jgi:hypothetical protein